MTTPPKMRTGGQILVDQLKIHGSDTIFCLPGESYLAALDAFVDHPGMRVIVCRQEGGASMMADAYGKLTGKPGICFVTRGPGATNASSGIHVAYQDSTPLILFIGQVAREMFDREAFQEIDYRRMYGQMAKWVAQIDDPARVPEYVSRAFHVATSGRPGPVVLALPEDMLTEPAAVADPPTYKRAVSHPGANELDQVRRLLSSAERPMMILGGGGWDEAGVHAIEMFAEANDLPTAVSFRCQDYFDNTHDNYIGHLSVGADPNLHKRVKEADLLLVLGARLGESTTNGYDLLDIPKTKQTLIHVYPDASELGRVYHPDLPIVSGMGAFAVAAAEMGAVSNKPWGQWTRDARNDYLEFLKPVTVPGAVQMPEVVSWLRETLPEDAIITNGAGNFAIWNHRFYQWRRYRSQLAPTSGSMGYGVPAAVAAKAVHPDRPVVCYAGDGCFMMTSQEFATACQYNLPIIVIVVNNGMFGTIRMHQEREYPKRISATELKNPDFAAFARAFGGHGETVEKTEDFKGAFERAQASGKPAIIELKVDPEALTPRMSLTQIREAALAAGR